MGRVAWKFAGVILQAIGILLMTLCGFMLVAFLLGGSINGIEEIGAGLLFMASITGVIFTGLPGYFLYKHGKKMLGNPSNILDQIVIQHKRYLILDSLKEITEVHFHRIRLRRRFRRVTCFL